MTGTGTQTDPYIVDNLSDLLSAISNAGAYVALDQNSANKVIDFNDDPKWYTKTPFVFACKYLNGNGWSIRNVMVKNCNFLQLAPTTYTTIENLNIESAYILSTNTNGNIYVLSVPNSDTGSSKLTLKNCKISAVLDALSGNISFSYVRRADMFAYNCSFNVTLKNNAVINSTNIWENCNIIVNGNSSQGTPLSFNVLDTCKISGSLICTHFSTLVVTLTSSSSYNVIDFELIGKSNTDISIRNYGKTLVNTDKLKGFNNINLSDSTCGVTSSQMIDADYLNSIGFMIGE